VITSTITPATRRSRALSTSVATTRPAAWRSAQPLAAAAAPGMRPESTAVQLHTNAVPAPQGLGVYIAKQDRPPRGEPR
jgi:hypothetical protein